MDRKRYTRDWNAVRESQPQNYEVARADWRLRRVHRVSHIQDGERKLVLGPGSALIAGTAFTLEGRKLIIDFRAPSMAALLLDAAWQAALRAMRQQTAVKPVAKAGPYGYRNFEIPLEDSGALFDYLQSKLTSVLLSYAAIEAFCNDVLADKMAFGQTVPVPLGSKVVQMDAEDAQRRSSTEHKLGRLVPDLLAVPTPSGGPRWEAFVRLKKLRDEATHFKARKHKEGLGTEDASPLLIALYGAHCFEPAEDALSLVRYFYEGAELPPRWLLNPTWQRPSNASSV